MKLKKGINLGGFLSQCEHKEEHYRTFISENDITTIASWGFDHVRLPIDNEVIEDDKQKINQSGYEIIEKIIKWCRKAGLNIILDIHKVAGYDFNNASNNIENNLFLDEDLQMRFILLWQKMARRFSKYENVALELLNEVVEEKNADAWNELIERTVKAIREITRDTIIIYGGISWNSPDRIPYLKKTLDKNIMFTFHYYEPLLFTHQKAYWVAAADPNETICYPMNMEYYKLNSKKLGLQGRQVIESSAKTMGLEFHENLLRIAVDYARNMGVELYCGEFGVIELAPAEDTLRWFEDILKVFNKYDIGYSIWSYREMDFGFIGEHYTLIRNRILSIM